MSGVTGSEGHAVDIVTPRVRVAASDSQLKKGGRGVVSSGSGPGAITAQEEGTQIATTAHHRIASRLACASIALHVDRCWARIRPCYHIGAAYSVVHHWPKAVIPFLGSIIYPLHIQM